MALHYRRCGTKTFMQAISFMLWWKMLDQIKGRAMKILGSRQLHKARNFPRREIIRTTIQKSCSTQRHISESLKCTANYRTLCA